MAHQINTLIAKLGDLSSVPRIHMVEGESQLLQNVP